MKLALDIVRQQIANLLLVHPELKEDDEAWLMTLESETEAINLFRQLEQRRQGAAHLAGAIASNIAELQERQERFVQREKAMRELMMKLMNFADIRKMELPEATLSIRNGQQKLIGGDHNNIEGLHWEFIRTKSEPDREKIKQALKAGRTVTGFTLSNAEPVLAIRTK